MISRFSLVPPLPCMFGTSQLTLEPLDLCIQYVPLQTNEHVINPKCLPDSACLCPSRPQPEEAVPHYEATVAMESVQHHKKKKAVVQL